MLTSSVTTRTVVIADDTAFVRDRFRIAIEQAGHQAIGVTHTAALVTLLRTASARPDLILLDLRLPGSSGTEGVRTIRTIDDRVTLLVFSGTIASAAEVRALTELDVKGYINEYSAPSHILPALAPHLFPDSFNRRGSPRVVLGVPVQYRFQQTIAVAVTLNLGRGGIAIRTTSPLESGTKLSVRFRVPGSKRDVDASGTVLWSDRRVGMGIQFESIDPVGQAAIDQFVDAHFFSNRKA